MARHAHQPRRLHRSTVSARPRRSAPLIVLAAALAFTSGAMDVASFTQLGGAFCSVMTGNLVLLGLAAARGSGQLAVHTAVAFAGYIAGYIAGAALGGRIGARPRSADVLWPAPVTATLLVELLALAGFTVGWELAGGYRSAPGDWACSPSRHSRWDCRAPPCATWA